MQLGEPQGSVLSPTLYILYVNHTPLATGVNPALFGDDTCLYATEHKERHVLRKLPSGLGSMQAYCRCSSIKINEDKTQALYYPYQIRPTESLLTLNGQNILFANSVQYFVVIFNKKITWRLHLETVETKAFRLYITIYSPFKTH
jgi:hypothetical protein